MQIKLVVLDIDGTILSSDGRLTPQVRQAIAAVKAKGVKITLATGRRSGSALPWAYLLKLTAPIIIHNGAVIVESLTGNVCLQKGIPLTIANALIKDLDNKKIPHMVYGGGTNEDLGVISSRFQYSRPSFLKFIDEQLILTEKIALAEPPIKISALARSLKVKPLLDELRKKYSAVTNMIVYHSQQYVGIDFMPQGCSKAKGIQYLFNSFKLSWEEVLVIGDDNNDIEMIQKAGFGVAMFNAPQYVKEQAIYVAPSNDENGVAHVLQKFCL